LIPNKKCAGWSKNWIFIFWDHEIYFSKNDLPRCNFVGNRLRVFPIPENASMPLIQGKIEIEAKIVIFRIFYMQVTFLTEILGQYFQESEKRVIDSQH
jgi:hypothetical protein